jgi:lysozyme
MKTSQRGVDSLIGFEGFRSKAYVPVPGDKWTIGFGFTEGVKEGDSMTKRQAVDRLVTELVPYERAVYEATDGAVNQNQFDALVSLAYNIGVSAFRKSTVLKAHKRGDYSAAARAFSMWNKSGGKVYQGLVNRRAAEAALYLEPMGHEPLPEMPQTIDAEPAMASSSINRAGVVAGGTAAIATATETINTLSGLKYSVSSLGDWLVPLLLIVTIGAIGYIVWERFNQRKQGYK